MKAIETSKYTNYTAPDLALFVTVLGDDRVDGSLHGIIIDALMTYGSIKDYTDAHKKADEICLKFYNLCTKPTAKYGYLPEAAEAAEKVPSASVLEALQWTATYFEHLEKKLPTLFVTH